MLSGSRPKAKFGGRSEMPRGAAAARQRRGRGRRQQGAGQPRVPALPQKRPLAQKAGAKGRTEESKDFNKASWKEIGISRPQLVSEGDREQAVW